MSVIAGLPPPTALVHSGGGLYPWWLLHEPLLLDDANRAGIEDLSRRCHATAAAHAAGLGFHVGNTGDLARILRVAGTVNRKAGLSRPVRLLPADGRRYTLDELRAALDSAAPPDDPPPRSHRQAERTTGAGLFDLIEDYVTFGDLLLPAGWTFVRTEHDGAELWKRPGDPSSEYSARAYLNGTRLLQVHSDASGLPYGPGNALTVGRLCACLHQAGTCPQPHGTSVPPPIEPVARGCTGATAAGS